MNIKDAYIKAEGYNVQMKGTGEELLALFSGIVSQLKYECEAPEKLIRMAVDFGLEHDANKMEEEVEEESEDIKDEIKSKLEKLMKLLED